MERRLFGESSLIFGLDEVGRGALAGPVTVGACVIDSATADAGIPDGLRDSKLISEKKRPELAERAAAWVRGTALGWATPGEVDDVGILGALGLAATRALAHLRQQGYDAADGIVLLDGNHDYVSRVAATSLGRIDVRSVIKGDRDCASISAASIAAKVARDELMTELHPDFSPYAWNRNKGYGSAAHRAAIAEFGLTPHHRHSWVISPPASLF
nr:ribonuclease HII [Microbacterium amylolyticum]